MIRQLAGSPQPSGPDRGSLGLSRGLIGVLAYYPGFWILLFQLVSAFGFFCFSGFSFSMASFLEILDSSWPGDGAPKAPNRDAVQEHRLFSILERGSFGEESSLPSLPPGGRGSMIESLPLGSHFALTRLRSTVPRRYGHRV